MTEHQIATHSRPRIGLVGGVEFRRVWRLDVPLRYADRVLAAGGIPLALPALDAEQLGPAALETALDAYLDSVDGLLLTGGDDFDTERLGLGPTHPEAVPVAARKQDFDLALVRAGLARELPMLGVCYGMQLMALAEGGRLHQHLPEDLPDARAHHGDVEHDVTIEQGTKLARAAGVGHLNVISRHHQAISDVRAPWRVTARDDQGLIEAIERDDHPFALGVQWHPELSAADGPHGAILRAFVRAAAGAVPESVL